MGILRREQLDSALEKDYRQYLTGHLANPRPNLKHIDDDIEIGMTFYREFTADTPHVHPVCVEHAYILSGSVMVRLLDGRGAEYTLREGDFFVLPAGIPYVSKNAAGTRVLFVKSPGMNDKTPVNPDEDTLRWMASWDT